MEVSETRKKWNLVSEVMRREYGYPQNITCDPFARGCYSSSYMTHLMKFSHNLEQPPDTTRVVNFNNHGDLICAGCSSDEWKESNIGIINWSDNKVKIIIKTEEGIKDVHFVNAVNNIDQLNVVSVYKSGQLRYDKWTPDGGHQKLQSFELSNESQRLAKCTENANCLLSASKSGKIFHIDLRCGQHEAVKLSANTVADDTNVKLQSISHHPLNQQFCASYDDYYVRTFDKRRLDQPIHEMMPSRLKHIKKRRAFTSDSFYNYDGTEILAVFTTSDIFLLDSENKRPGQVKQSYGQLCYKIDCTNKTSFFGPKSEYIVLGDDHLSIVFLDKITKRYVGNVSLRKHLRGYPCTYYFQDLKSHPHLPIVAAAAGYYSILSPANIEEGEESEEEEELEEEEGEGEEEEEESDMQASSSSTETKTDETSTDDDT